MKQGDVRAADSRVRLEGLIRTTACSRKALCDMCAAEEFASPVLFNALYSIIGLISDVISVTQNFWTSKTGILIE